MKGSLASLSEFMSQHSRTELLKNELLFTVSLRLFVVEIAPRDSIFFLSLRLLSWLCRFDLDRWIRLKLSAVYAVLALVSSVCNCISVASAKEALRFIKVLVFSVVEVKKGFQLGAF